MAKRRVVRALITEQASTSNVEVQTEQPPNTPAMTFKGRAVTTTNSVAAKKDHLLTFNLSKSLCLPEDMEKHDHLTELKAIRSATKLMVLVNAKDAELKALKTNLAVLATEKEKLAELVNAAETVKQKAPAEKKDRYLRELAKIEKKKNAEIQELQKKMEDVEDQGFKEGEETYVQQCEATKDIFFKCG
ncbi:hypothetical protein CsSME_00015749 [Camellia sinensis var. sinensis]